MTLVRPGTRWGRRTSGEGVRESRDESGVEASFRNEGPGGVHCVVLTLRDESETE